MAHFRGQKRAYHDQFDNYQHKRPYNAPAQRAQDPYNRYQVWNAEREVRHFRPIYDLILTCSVQ